MTSRAAPAVSGSPGHARLTRLQRGSMVALVREDLAPALRESALFTPRGLSRALQTGAGAEGRAATASLGLEGVDGAIVVRRVLHGGALGPLWGGAIVGLRRARKELETTAALRAAGAPVPQPAFAIGQRLFGPFFRAVLATHRERDALDAVAFLEREPEPPRIWRAAAALGEAVRRFHDAGGRHADLHVKNLLVRERGDDVEGIVIDLDRARMLPETTAARRMTELMRLHRSLHKRNLLCQVGARGCTRFFSAYLGGDRALRRAMLRRLPRERARLAFHALLYRREASGRTPRSPSSRRERRPHKPA